MDLRVYRICRAIHARLDGEGARRVGGRWNSRGNAVVYMAQSASLAILENLVHMSREDFPVGYVLIEAQLNEEDIIEPSDPKLNLYRHLPTDKFGDAWLASGISMAMRVPSTIAPSEHNYLLNPKHARFQRIIIAPPRPFHFDPRLFKDG